mmetsp:Transcript_23918/g.39322  ORF Transcript_23918/g.39322 Transcript_23918/m.39322 type:complete len:195 (-) Transcript_23918:44-628(-)
MIICSEQCTCALSRHCLRMMAALRFRRLCEFLRRSTGRNKTKGSVCLICMQRETRCVFMNCGHACACENCSQLLVRCPICREVLLSTCKASLKGSTNRCRMCKDKITVGFAMVCGEGAHLYCGDCVQEALDQAGSKCVRCRWCDGAWREVVRVYVCGQEEPECTNTSPKHCDLMGVNVRFVAIDMEKTTTTGHR